MSPPHWVTIVYVNKTTYRGNKLIKRNKREKERENLCSLNSTGRKKDKEEKEPE